MTQGLEQRIASALAADIASVDVAALIAEVDAAAAAADKAAERERERALDPTAVVDAAVARSAMDDAAFSRDRLEAALPRLKVRLEQVRAQEYLAVWREDFERVRVKRDALAAEFSERYSLVSQLIDLLCRMASNDAEISRLHQARPVGVSLHLRTAELEARGLDGFTFYEPSIAKDLRLPHFDRSSRQLAWPPPPALPDFAAITCAPAHEPRYSADWGTVAEAKERQIRKAQDAAELASLEKTIAEAERLGGGATWWVPREQERLKRLRAAARASGG